MRIQIILLALVSLLAMTVHASADFIFTPLTFLLFSSPLGAIFGPGAIYAGLQIAATAGLAAVQFALGRRSSPKANPQDIKNTRPGQEGPGRYATGRVRLGGRVGFGNTAGYNIYRLLLHCFGEFDLIEEYFYDGRSITVDPDGAVTSPPWATSGGSNLYVRSKMGTGAETAWSQLMADFPALWTSDHRVRGIGQSLIQVINPGTQNDRFQTLLQGGVKEVEVTARVGKFFDPRTGQTVWTRNGVLQCLHWFRLLPDMQDSLIDFDDIADLADEADVQVPTLTGTAPRCTISGGWEAELSTDIVEQMLESAGLEVRRTAAGLYTFRFIEDDPDSELTLLNRHIIDRDFASEEAAKRPNLCRVSYFSPERQYDLAEIDLTADSPWARVQSDIDKYGDKEDHPSLPFCDDASQAQRIVRRLFWMKRAKRGVIRTTFAGVAAWGKRVITIEIPDVGTDGESSFVKCRVVAPMRIIDSEGVCEIPVAIVPDELTVPWNPATMEAPAPPVLPDFQYESALPTPAAPSEAAIVQYPGGAWETRVKFSGVSGGTTAEANYRDFTGGLPDAWAAMTEYQSGSAWYGYAAADTSGDRTDFRVRFANGDGDLSYFSDVLEVDPLDVDNTVPSAPTIVSAGRDPDTGIITMTVDVTEMRVCKLELWYRRFVFGVPNPDWTLIDTTDCRPGQTVLSGQGNTGSSQDIDFEYRTRAFVSDGTPGPFAVDD